MRKTRTPRELVIRSMLPSVLLAGSLLLGSLLEPLSQSGLTVTTPGGTYYLSSWAGLLRITGLAVVVFSGLRSWFRAGRKVTTHERN